MVIMRLLGKFYDKLTYKSSSIVSAICGIINLLWIYNFDRYANGLMHFSRPPSIEQWVIIANITLYVLLLLPLLSLIFGIIGTIKASKDDRRWIIIAIIGMLLGLLPLIIYGASGRIWFRTLYL